MTVSDALHKKLEETKMRQAMMDALETTMAEVMAASIQEAPGPGNSKTGKATGNLRRSHSVDVRLSGRVFEGLLRNSANYWQYVNFGTSKMDANDFVTRAFESSNPSESLAKNFKSNYKP